MSGIVFFSSTDLPKVKSFYLEKIGAEIWRDQGKCIIFEKNGFRFGFCSDDQKADTCGVLTFVYDSREQVDEVYQKLKDIGKTEPVSRRPEFDIYQFYAEDPEGRTLEFQTFMTPPE